MKVLVSGNRGFVGMHLCEELRSVGYEVVGHDFEEGDLRDKGVFEASLRKHAPDQVVHLAGQVGRVLGEDDPHFTITENALIPTYVGKACAAQAVPVLFSSTSEIYGDHGEVECDENTVPRLPHNLYGLSKRWGEEALSLYAPEDLQIVRLTMPYGPGVPPGRGRRAMDNLLWQAATNQPMIVHRGGERSWCHIRDMVRGIRMVMERGSETFYNIGRDDRYVSMERLAEMCCELAGAPLSLIEVVDPPQAQTVVKRISTERIQALGWTAEIELERALPEMLAWVKNFDAQGDRISW